jgi:hypothetical protein
MADEKGPQHDPRSSPAAQPRKDISKGGGIGNNGEQDRGKRSVNEPGAARSDPAQKLD